MLDMFIGGFRALIWPFQGDLHECCVVDRTAGMRVVDRSERNAGRWDGHLPLPYLIALTPSCVDSDIGDCDCRCRTA